MSATSDEDPDPTPHRAPVSGDIHYGIKLGLTLDHWPLCDRDMSKSFSSYFATKVPSKVTCQDCIEWMHA